MVGTAKRLGGDVTIVNFGGCDKSLRRQIASCRSNTRIVEVRSQRYFNKAKAHNLGAFYAHHPVLFFCDCDIILEPIATAALARSLLERTGVFATFASARESSPNSRRARNVVRFGYELRIETRNGRELRIIDYEEDANDGTRQAPGLLLVRREDFIAVNGYNGRLQGWGWEDQDMVSRLTLSAGLERMTDGSAIHISHDDAARTANYAVADRWENRDRMFRQALAYYDDSDFAGTYDRDVVEVDNQLLLPNS